MQNPVGQVRYALQTSTLETPQVPSHWRDMRQHMFYGEVYHFFLHFVNRPIQTFRDNAICL